MTWLLAMAILTGYWPNNALTAVPSNVLVTVANNIKPLYDVVSDHKPTIISSWLVNGLQ